MDTRYVAAVVGIGFVGLAIACGRDLVQPTEDLPADVGASTMGAGIPGEVGAPPPGAGLSRVFKELGSASELISGLSEGECVLQYRRPNGKYTPIPYQLSTGRSPSATRTRPVVYRGWRWDDEIGVRAVCIAPAGSDETFRAAVAEILERARQPAFARDANGAVRLFHEVGGPQTASAGRDVLPGTLAELRVLLLKNAQLLFALASKFGPKPLYASIGDPCNEDPNPGDDDETCEIDGIDVEGEDPCDDEYGYWDDAWQECVCWNGEDWEPPEGDEPCVGDDEIPDPPSDTTSGGSGDDPGSGDEECDDGGGDVVCDPPCDDDLGECEEAEIVVTCSPSSVVRASSTTVTCQADASGGALVMQGWTFAPLTASVVTVGGLDPVPGPASTPWSGQMLVMGDVIATGTVAGETQTSESASIDVTARNLVTFGYFEYEQPTLGVINNSNPTLNTDIAYTQPDIVGSFPPSAVIEGSGPNQGYKSLNTFPFTFRPTIFLNETQFQQGSALWNLAPEAPDSLNHCPRSYIADPGPNGLRAALLRHEGVNYEPGSHTGEIKAAFEADETTYQLRLEALVASVTIGSANAFTAMTGVDLNTWLNAPEHAADTGWNNIPCRLRGISS